MLKKMSIATSLVAMMACLPVHADNYTSCSVELAVSSPPVKSDQYVAFNVRNEDGINRSITLSGGSGPVTFEQLICSDMPYTVSATLYSRATNQLTYDAPPAIGQCELRAGSIVLGAANSSLSAVFPKDFDCK